MVVIDVFLVYLGINIYRAKYLSDDSATHIRQMYIPTFLGFSVPTCSHQEEETDRRGDPVHFELLLSH